MTEASPDFSLNSTAPQGPAASLQVSERALKKIAAERQKRNQPDLMFRVTVSGGGCSGLQYQFGYDEAGASGDDLTFPVEADIPSVVTDEVSLRFLKGAILDYEQDMMGSRFAIKNPNAVSGCGCGVSFAVDFSKIGL